MSDGQIKEGSVIRFKITDRPPELGLVLELNGPWCKVKFSKCYPVNLRSASCTNVGYVHQGHSQMVREGIEALLDEESEEGEVLRHYSIKHGVGLGTIVHWDFGGNQGLGIVHDIATASIPSFSTHNCILREDGSQLLLLRHRTDSCKPLMHTTKEEQEAIIAKIEEGRGSEALQEQLAKKIEKGSIVKFEYIPYGQKESQTHVGLVTDYCLNSQIFIVFVDEYDNDWWAVTGDRGYSNNLRKVGEASAESKRLVEIIKAMDTETNKVLKVILDPYKVKRPKDLLHPSEIKWNSIESTRSRGFPVWEGVPVPVLSKSFKEPLKEIDPKDCYTNSDLNLCDVKDK